MSAKKPWFGPKPLGIGLGPRTWQGKLIVLAFLIVEAVVIWSLFRYEPGWIGPKPWFMGIGWTARTWQGWVALLAPIVVFVLVSMGIYYKQKADKSTDESTGE